MKSSVWGIPYEIRPSKQVERRLIMETLLLAREAGVDTRMMPYVGMGGVRYIDMLLAHKVLGIKRFKSLEHDETLWGRCQLNRPFDDLEVYEGSAADFITKEGFKEPAVVWFDLEKMVSKDAQNDIVSVATSIKPNSFLFITATAEMPEALNGMKMERRLSFLKDQFSPFADKLPIEWMNKQHFHMASAFLAMKFLSFGLVGRSDGSFRHLVNIAYRDSSWMTTVGGYFGPSAQGNAIFEKVGANLSFLPGSSAEEAFTLEQFNITDVERALFDRASTPMARRRSAKNQLKSLGFRDTIIEQYVDLMRFIPRYIESAL